MTSRTISFSLFIFSSLFLIGISCYPSCAGQEFVPFVVEATGSHVNVRAGQSANFEQLCQLEKGEQVIVVGKEFSWYKIQLPPSAKSFVSKDYIQYLGKNAGGVTANKVNIRAGAGIHHTVLGQLFKGEQIYILEEFEEWYRIEPIAKSYGWVSNQFLSFKSNETSEFQVTRPVVPVIEELEQVQELILEEKLEEEVKVISQTTSKQKLESEFIEAKDDVLIEDSINKLNEQLIVEEKIETVKKPGKILVEKLEVDPKKDLKEGFVKEFIEEPEVNKLEVLKKEPTKQTARKLKKPKYQGVISVVGTVVPHEDHKGDAIYYKIVVDGIPVCYVQGTNHMLGRFINHQVTVDGTVNQRLLDHYNSPVISVVKVRLMI